MERSLTIRIAEKKDHQAIWEIIEPVIARGDTYVFGPDSGKDKMLEY